MKFVGVQDWKRKLFDELIPLPDGTSYNAYIVNGKEKTALIDTVDPPFCEEFLSNIGSEQIDYVISNHAEQDHSGCIPAVLEKCPNAVLVTNAKNKQFLMDHLHIDESRFKVIEDNEELDLGGKTLKFIMAPWVHWPETMLTFLKEDKVLFPCDLFGAHLASDSVFVTDKKKLESSAKRYYAEIMMPFRNIIPKHITRVEELAPKIIAPSHGPVHKEPGFIIDLYKDWTGPETNGKALILYVSMHGSTKAMVDRLMKTLGNRGETINLTGADLGDLAIRLVDTEAVIVASPMVLAGMHPTVLSTVYLFNALRPKTKYLGFMGSYGWGGKMLEQLQSMITAVKAETLEPVLVKGLPREDDLKKVDELGQQLLQKLGTCLLRRIKKWK